MSSQTALVIEKIGSPIVPTTRPIPTPKEDQVQIKVSVAGLNPHDAKAAFKGLFIANTLPSTLAIDLVGPVTAVGSKVTKFSVGDHVFGFGSPFDPDQQGTQEYAVLSEGTTMKVPKGWDAKEHELATLTLNPLTAFSALFTEAGLGISPPAPFYGHNPSFDYAGMKLVIVGGGAACGKYAIELAKYAGIGTVVAVASKRGEKELLSLGATHVVDRHGSEDEVAAEVRKIVGDDLLHVFDAVNGDGQWGLGAKVLSNSKKGTQTVIAGQKPLDESLVAAKPAGIEHRHVMAGMHTQPELAASYWGNVSDLIVKGFISPTSYSVIEGLDADKVNEALAGYNEGKAVVKPQLQL